MIKKTVELPEGYKPSDDEEYMNPMHLEFFRQKLESWKEDLLKESSDTLKHLRQENWNEADLNDRATVESDARFELKTRDRYRKLINKIDAALDSIENSTYGYCQDTGNKIGINRLLARPIATLSIEAQKKHEHDEG